MNSKIQYEKVADLYDYYVNVDFDIDFFLQEAKRTSGKVLELTSGTGRVSIPLLKAGVDLTCVDSSKEMLEILQKKLKKNRVLCKVFEMDMTDLALEDHYDLIFIPFHSFSEILDKSKQTGALQRINMHLSASGCFICTLQNPVIRVQSMDGTPKLSGRFPIDSGGSLAVQSLLNYDSQTQIAHGMQIYEIFDKHGKLIGQRNLSINFYLFKKAEFEDSVLSSGFRVLDLYGDYAYSQFDEETSPFMIWKLAKSESK